MTTVVSMCSSEHMDSAFSEAAETLFDFYAAIDAGNTSRVASFLTSTARYETSFGSAVGRDQIEQFLAARFAERRHRSLHVVSNLRAGDHGADSIELTADLILYSGSDRSPDSLTLDRAVTSTHLMVRSRDRWLLADRSTPKRT